MRTNWLLLWLWLWIAGLAAQAAEVCDPADLAGRYAFQLSGTTAISGSPKATASLGLLTFDGSGGVSGTSSATFSGLLLGNPVTGTYEAKWDCSVTWKLQDDSGAYQHFSGTISPDGTSVRFKQTGQDGPQNGIMKRTAESCSAADLKKTYSFTVAGRTTPMLPGERPHTVSTKGKLDIARNGSFQVERDCSVRFELTLPAQAGLAAETLSMRGFLVNGGREILAFQTDPGAMVAARFISDEK